MKLRISHVVVSVILIFVVTLASAQEKPKIAFVSPTINPGNVPQGEDARANASQIMSQVIPRVIKDGDKKKWPFRMLPQQTIPQIWESVVGSAQKQSEEVKFSYLKSLAEKVDCRYLIIFTVKELTAAYHNNFFGEELRARANIDLYVYDQQVNDYVWFINMEGWTKHPHNQLGDSGIRREQDGALNLTLTKALDPFAKGSRNTVVHSKTNILVSVQKIIADGKKVILDHGKDLSITVGAKFKSLETNCEIIVIECLENGAIADVTTGVAKEKETFKTF